MKRCPDCGFRTEDKICPLCGVKTKELPIPTHVHAPGESCMLSGAGQAQPREAGTYVPGDRPVRSGSGADGEKLKKQMLTMIKYVIFAIIAIEVLAAILDFI